MDVTRIDTREGSLVPINLKSEKETENGSEEIKDIRIARAFGLHFEEKFRPYLTQIHDALTTARKNSTTSDSEKLVSFLGKKIKDIELVLKGLKTAEQIIVEPSDNKKGAWKFKFVPKVKDPIDEPINPDQDNKNAKDQLNETKKPILLYEDLSSKLSSAFYQIFDSEITIIKGYTRLAQRNQNKYEELLDDLNPIISASDKISDETNTISFGKMEVVNDEKNDLAIGQEIKDDTEKMNNKFKKTKGFYTISIDANGNVNITKIFGLLSPIIISPPQHKAA